MPRAGFGFSDEQPSAPENAKLTATISTHVFIFRALRAASLQCAAHFTTRETPVTTQTHGLNALACFTRRRAFVNEQDLRFRVSMANSMTPVLPLQSLGARRR